MFGHKNLYKFQSIATALEAILSIINLPFSISIYMILGLSSLEVYEPNLQANTVNNFSRNYGGGNTYNGIGRPPFTHVRQKKQTNRAWNNHYQTNSSSSLTSLNQLQSRLAHLGLDSRPYFSQTQTHITVQEGMNAFFNCKVENIYNQTV